MARIFSTVSQILTKQNSLCVSAYMYKEKNIKENKAYEGYKS